MGGGGGDGVAVKVCGAGYGGGAGALEVERAGGGEGEDGGGYFLRGGEGGVEIGVPLREGPAWRFDYAGVVVRWGC